MTEYIENPLSGKLRGVTYEDGKIIDVHIRDTDDVVKVFVPVRHGRWKAYWDDIKAAPTVDAVPVVRCRECKYWGDEEGKLQCSDGALLARCKVHNYLIDGRHTGWCPTENDFCSYGERKEGAD